MARGMHVRTSQWHTQSFNLAYQHILQTSYHGISSRSRDPNYTYVFSLRLQ